MKAFERIKQSRLWLANDVFPLWTTKGIHPGNGSFVESLNEKGEPTSASCRALVQARQIYSYSEAIKMQILTQKEAVPLIKKSTDYLMKHYALSSGAFIYSINADGKPEALQAELYTQAFIIFCLARAYAVIPEEPIRIAAKKVLNYLKTERCTPQGGFTEIKNDKIGYHSNPHMHLFEAVIEWMKVFPDPDWKHTAISIYELCIKKFIDPKTGVVCEFFDSSWKPLLEIERFIFEPGHQYEWAWLMLEFKKVTGIEVGSTPVQLFEIAEKYGLDSSKKWVIDEVWSDFSVKKASSRFWPQCERIKTAVSLGLRSPPEQQPVFAKAADEGMEILFKYLKNPAKGLWRDTKFENGSFDQNPSKASSLYHIINALSEYESKRPLMKAL